MTVTVWELLIYAGGVFILFITPGPVWMAIAARSLSGGIAAAWPLALGVVVGDLVWPLTAILGVSWVSSSFEALNLWLKGVAVVMFVGLGVQTIRTADRPIAADSRLTRPGAWAGFVAGMAVILGNPKAVLFYLGLLPGFFDLSRVTTWDIVAIVAVSQVVPLAGNLMLAGLVDRLRGLLSSAEALARVNRIAGWLLIAVGVAIAVV